MHAGDELHIAPSARARPIQAAFASAASFTVGAAMPLLAVFMAPARFFSLAVAAASLVFLAILGALGARIGKAIICRGTLRATF